MIRTLLCLAASAVLACGANPPKAVPAAKGQFTAATDAQIEQILKAKLAKSKIGEDKLTFRVQGGVVTWNGSTNVIQHKGTATRMAKTSGARAVVNNIQVSEAAKQRARENLENGRRRAQIKRSEPRSEARNEAARSR